MIAPGTAKDAVCVRTADGAAGDRPVVAGPDFDALIDCGAVGEEPCPLLASLATQGFQATKLAEAADEVRRMRAWRGPSGERAAVFLAYTSNMVSCGNREVLRFVARHRLADVLVCTAGGIEEDFIKCLAPTLVGDFALRGAALRAQGLNRIGNLIMPNSNYCAFEDWLAPVLDAMAAEQRDGRICTGRCHFPAPSADPDDDHSAPPRPYSGCCAPGPDAPCRAARWTPSRVIARLGAVIADERSIYYWAARWAIPVFSPALTDGSLGDMLFFHSFSATTEADQIALDIVQDLRALNTAAMRAPAAGMIVLGGGLVKHHVCNACLMRNGAEFAVFINTASEWDGSDAGAAPDEAVSWGKIRVDASPVKVSCDAAIAFPLLVRMALVPEVAARRNARLRAAGSSLYL